ncbi:hypothetical protein AB0I81_22965 [Nonomuraea sp. NPDC050404]|uniref:hypothetical protein n=1 Tax=Nonomuraea sp. NPDC050404 TaxID=3155783 RepID=UPI003406E45B
MATVRQLINPDEGRFLASGSATPWQENGANLPVPGRAFDASVTSSIFFLRRLASYGSGSLTLNITWYAAAASTGVVRWSGAVAKIKPNTDSQDPLTKTFATSTDTDDTHLGTVATRVHGHDIVISATDSAAAGDLVWVRLQRLGAHANDNMAGAAILLDAELSYSDT